MSNQLPVLFYVATVYICAVSASHIQSTASQLFISPTPPPLLVSPTPEIISYSTSPIAAKTERVESYQTVTTHPAPVRYIASPVTYAVRPQYRYSSPVLVKSIPSSLVSNSQYLASAPATPIYVQNIQEYTPAVTKYAATPTYFKYPTPVVTKTVKPVVKYVKAPLVRVVEKPAVSYADYPVQVVQKYVSSGPVEAKYVQSYTSPVYENPVQPIPVPVEYPVGYTPVPEAYAKQAYAVPTYAKAHSYSPSTSVSRVSFNGLGTSYVY